MKERGQFPFCSNIASSIYLIFDSVFDQSLFFEIVDPEQIVNKIEEIFVAD